VQSVRASAWPTQRYRQPFFFDEAAPRFQIRKVPVNKQIVKTERRTAIVADMIVQFLNDLLRTAVTDNPLVVPVVAENAPADTPSA
jgi:hypothetical protein